jgi:hypothetical protein
MHTNICEPFPTQCLNDQLHFIFIIDDHTRFMYLYLLNDKVETLNAFKTYKVEVRKQKRNKIKIIIEVENVMIGRGEKKVMINGY